MQNFLTNTNFERKISIIKRYKGQNNKHGNFINSFKYNLNQKEEKLSKAWKWYRFFDYINAVQCFKSYNFGHIAKECKLGKSVCPKSADNHKMEECTSQEIICAICKYAATVLNVQGFSNGFNWHFWDKSSTNVDILAKNMVHTLTTTLIINYNKIQRRF